MTKQASREQVAAYLALFDNDVESAIAAVRSYKPMQIANALSVNPAAPVINREGPPLISVNAVTKEYRIGHQKVEALRGVSLRVYEGEIVAITGSSGSGKSTLLQLIGGLDKPTSGSVSVANTDLSKMSDHTLSRFRGQTIGFVFQSFYLQPFLNLGRNLEVPGMFAGTPHRERHQRVQELAAAVGLTERLQHLPKELSGGQIQRAAIARALFNRPKVILADEPTGNLDSKNGMAIIDLFEQIRRNFNTTIVIITHDYAIAQRADRHITLKDGEVVL